MTWSPITSAPKNGLTLLVFEPGDPDRPDFRLERGDRITLAYYHTFDGVWVDLAPEAGNAFAPTHWCLLPEPPA